MKVFNYGVMAFNAVMALINIIAGDVQYATFFMVLVILGAVSNIRLSR